MSDTPQTIDSTQPQAIPAPKVRRSRKAPAIKTAVVLKRANGEPISHIARDLGITHNTTRGIIEEMDVDRQLQTYADQSLELVPEALRVMRVRLLANSENAAIKTLESTIWPLTDKRGKGTGDQKLVFAIQNLMGNVQVVENKPVEPVSASSTGTIALPNNSAIDAQVIESKGSDG